MAFTKLTTDVQNIQKLEDQPNDTTGLTAAQLKVQFDKAPQDIKDYINNVLISEMESKLATNEALQQVIAGQVNTVDPVTGSKYAFIIENGSVGIEEVS